MRRTSEAMMAETAVNRKSSTEKGIDNAIGKALKDLREQNDQTARDLSSASGVSAAMISRIESGQVSPSLSTLESLAGALEVPIVSLLRETSPATADITHVKGGRGLVSTRFAGRHSHNFTALGFHRRPELQFEALLITLDRHDEDKPPLYNGYGCLFVYILEGEAIYTYGDRQIQVEEGDSLCLDAELRYGIKEVLTPRLRYLSVQAKGR